MSDWDPERYRRFEAERTRPAFDLLARVMLDDPTTVVDLGCGPGNSTELLIDRYPTAQAIGLDSSAAMIAAARKRLPKVTFEEADIATWQPRSAPDLIFANAVLQWLPDHASLIPRLYGLLRPGGILAIQMPDNLEEPSHRAMRAVAGEQPWADVLRDARAARTTLPPMDAFYDLLVGLGASVDVWRTTYNHPMPSPDAIIDWLRATGLRPFLDGLTPMQQSAFLDRYREMIDDAYPSRADGSRLLRFPRLFIVARRPPH